MSETAPTAPVAPTSSGYGSSRTTGIPVLVVSTNPHLLDKAREQAARFGTHHYLVKPFDLDDPLAAIDEMIGAA